eukprot:m.92612 g.92612  ORF g.92612 m.92612 type:complete len:118 (+) comp36747_c0_seq9:525-878(+)
MILLGVLILLELITSGQGNFSGDDVSPTTDDETRYCEKIWSGHSSLCFKLFPDAVNYTEAEAKCQEHNGHLVSIHGVIEHAHVLSLFVGVKESWIGLSDRMTEGIYRWEDGLLFRLS